MRRDGKVACPFHADHQPSLHAYPEPDRGWACYSAKCWQGDRPNAGDIYDFAGQLWLTGQSAGMPLRGRRFIEVRERLMTVFFGDGKHDYDDRPRALSSAAESVVPRDRGVRESGTKAGADAQR